MKEIEYEIGGEEGEGVFKYPQRSPNGWMNRKDPNPTVTDRYRSLTIEY